MAIVRVELETSVRRTFRVEQVAGMLDVAVGERIGHSLTAEVPGLDEEWTTGAIVERSGSGKTTLARAAFGEAVNEAPEWPRERAIVDVLGEANDRNGRLEACPTVKEVARVLTAVGLGSVPTWLKPYQVLSAGERFRADLARALLERGGNLTQRHGGTGEAKRRVLVVDEFTSALDRTVAKTTSAAVARLLRKGPVTRGQEPVRLVVVTCHLDVLPWLAPDWVVELDHDCNARLVRCGWPRFEMPLEIRRVPQAMWKGFARHHYLAGGLAASATCYGAFVEEWERRRESEGERGRLIGFCAVVAALGWKKTKRITRLVVLPEFQGLGIASRLLAEIARIEAARGNRVTITASHPAVVEHCSRSPAWRFIGVKKTGSTQQRFAGREIRSSRGRAVAGFEWQG